MRNERIDLLRFIGLAMIILAHTNPPEIIFQARNFDVPLMVVVAGLSFRASYRLEPYFSYLWNRVKRLIFPVWLFLTFYFLVVNKTGYPIALPNFRKIIESYLFLDGIGYVWVIRVFLLVSIVSPLIYSYCQREKSDGKYLLSVTSIYLLYEIITIVSAGTPQTLPIYILENIFFYLIPYAVVFSIGLRLPDLSRNQLFTVSAAAFLIFIVGATTHLILSGKLIATQNFKYPPQSYYLSYAIFVSTLLWLASEKATNTARYLKILPAILFVGQNSIWIYLWHIPLIKIIQMPFILKYTVVFLSASLITLIQLEFVKKYILPKVGSPELKKNLRGLLTG